ncbi:fibrillarin-like rRNA/tRNA 2'-O-methyltransferase [Candidatus Woesearchaeota archaeon]|nr:fibrillarin-like rRNA/tRNA 2'-O-methyltransferase [Candidatus Woesearchaeota archaeon]
MRQLKKFNVYEYNRKKYVDSKDKKSFEDKASKRFLYTINLVPGKSLFEEELVKHKGIEYRAWDIYRSKLGAAVKKGISQIGVKQGDKVLYLGAAHGFTPSHVSDIVGKDGFVFCVDNAPRVVRDLIFICEERTNMAPILADANHPEEYKELITKEVDVVYQDIAQRNQVDIFLKNCDAYLKKGGFGLLAVKARSIDVSQRPKDIFKEVRKQLEQSSMNVVDYRELEPYEKDHAMFVCKRK